MGTRGSRRALFAGLVTVTAVLAGATVAGGVVGPTSLVSRPTNVADPGPTDIKFVGASRDGSHVFFQTTKQMVPEDRDSNRLDVYERFKGRTTLMSGPTGVVDPNSSNVKYRGISEDGLQVFFETTERLDARDSDGGKSDVYVHGGGATKLVSTPTTGGIADPGNGTAVFSGVSRDGTTIFFATDQSLTEDDHDGGHYDIYKRLLDRETFLASRATKLTEPAGTPGGVDFAGSSYDGRTVFFETFQKLDPDDTDLGKVDVYSNSPTGTSLESKPAPGTGEENVEDIHFAGASADGNHIYFSTKQRMTGDDNDSHWIDVFERFGDQTFLSSAAEGIPDPDNDNVFLKGISEDGTRVYFETKQRLAADDTDRGQRDVYERSAGSTKLLSKGTISNQGDHDAFFGRASLDGTHVFFYTRQRLTTDDRDPAGKALNDIYERAGGTTVLSSKPARGVSRRARGFDVTFQGASLKGNRVFFSTPEKLVPYDFDSNRSDIYERAGRTTSLVSRPTDTNDPDLLGPSTWVGTSDLGSIVFFQTRDKLTSRDRDNRLDDLYAAGSPDPGKKPVNEAPRINRLRVSGRRITFNLSERATVRFTFARKSGRRYRGVRGGFSVKAKVGANRIRFRTRGRLGKGTFRVRAVARDSKRKKSKAATRTFRIR